MIFARKCITQDVMEQEELYMSVGNNRSCTVNFFVTQGSEVNQLIKSKKGCCKDNSESQSHKN